LQELELREKQLLVLQEEARKAAEQTAEIKAIMLEKEAQLKAFEERLKQQEAQKRQQREATRQKQIQEQEIKKKSQTDGDIPSPVAASESGRALSCPLCKEGEIVSKITEKGKVFFSCTQPECRFVSWDKPYPFECPLCKNLFLTETLSPSGEKGLKCPRASCSYTQGNLLNPKQNMAAQPFSGPVPKKKKKIVRIRKRR
jgi:ssDNA-binding Zn-finger/Zn-ribbon topoisomerase 1